MVKEKLYQWIIPGLILIVLAGLVIYQQSKDRVLGLAGNTHRVPGVLTTKTIAPTLNGGVNNPVASSTLLFGVNEDRRYARCTNLDSSGFPIFIVLGANSTLGYGATTTGRFGIILAPLASTTDAYFEINENNPFTGAVYASALATTTISCIEN